MADVNFYLQQIDLRKIIQNTDIKNMEFDNIHPDLTIDDFWDNEFIERLIMLFEDFKQFYQHALKIIVRIDCYLLIMYKIRHVWCVNLQQISDK